jgi:hypothetical protein
MGDSSISFNWWLTGRIIYKLIKVKKKKKACGNRKSLFETFKNKVLTNNYVLSIINSEPVNRHYNSN